MPPRKTRARQLKELRVILDGALGSREVRQAVAGKLAQLLQAMATEASHRARRKPWTPPRLRDCTDHMRAWEAARREMAAYDRTTLENGTVAHQAWAMPLLEELGYVYVPNLDKPPRFEQRRWVDAVQMRSINRFFWRQAWPFRGRR
jgi:hypothetical protein